MVLFQLASHRPAERPAQVDKWHAHTWELVRLPLLSSSFVVLLLVSVVVQMSEKTSGRHYDRTLSCIFKQQLDYYSPEKKGPMTDDDDEYLSEDENGHGQDEDDSSSSSSSDDELAPGEIPDEEVDAVEGEADDTSRFSGKSPAATSNHCTPHHVAAKAPRATNTPPPPCPKPVVEAPPEKKKPPTKAQLVNKAKGVAKKLATVIPTLLHNAAKSTASPDDPAIDIIQWDVNPGGQVSVGFYVPIPKTLVGDPATICEAVIKSYGSAVKIVKIAKKPEDPEDTEDLILVAVASELLPAATTAATKTNLSLPSRAPMDVSADVVAAAAATTTTATTTTTSTLAHAAFVKQVVARSKASIVGFPSWESGETRPSLRALFLHMARISIESNQPPHADESADMVTAGENTLQRFSAFFSEKLCANAAHVMHPSDSHLEEVFKAVLVTLRDYPQLSVGADKPKVGPAKKSAASRASSAAATATAAATANPQQKLCGFTGDKIGGDGQPEMEHLNLGNTGAANVDDTHMCLLVTKGGPSMFAVMAHCSMHLRGYLIELVLGLLDKFYRKLPSTTEKGAAAVSPAVRRAEMSARMGAAAPDAIKYVAAHCDELLEEFVKACNDSFLLAKLCGYADSEATKAACQAWIQADIQ